MDMENLLAAMRAAAESTRLRLLLLCASAELTVSDLTQILGQSQPRVSRHLKVLCDAGLLDRSREGTSAYFRLTRRGPASGLARTLAGLADKDVVSDPLVQRDRQRLEAVKKARAEAAAAYFRDNAARWDSIRSLHVEEGVVERALLEGLGLDMPEAEPIADLLDIGTGTGRILELVAGRVGTATGIDLSREMLGLARARLERAGLPQCTVRHGDMYQLPWPENSFDAITIHQVLHYAEDPAQAVAEAARVLRPGGRIVIADFAPHRLVSLHDEHAHRHLGFSDADVVQWLRDAGIKTRTPVHLAGAPLTVTIWAGRKSASAEKASSHRSASRPHAPAAASPDAATSSAGTNEGGNP